MNFIKKICYNISLLHFYLYMIVNMIFAWLAGKYLHEFATLTQGGSSYELDAARNTQSLLFFLFCIIWAASVRRLKSLLKWDIMLFTMTNVILDVIFAKYMLKTKWLLEDRLGLHIFVLFLSLLSIYLRTFICLEVYFLP